MQLIVTKSNIFKNTINMKKIATLLLFSLAVCAYSQVDTIHAWQRVRGYYYQDTNWWDHYCFQVGPLSPASDHNYFYSHTLEGERPNETARICYSDTIIKVVGVAAAISTRIPNAVLDTVLGHMPTEYFRIYEQGGYGLSLLRQAAVDRKKTVHKMAVEYYRQVVGTDGHIEVDSNENIVYSNVEGFGDVYESYFESPVLVSDTFYVSGTKYSNSRVKDSHLVEMPEYGVSYYQYDYYLEHPLTGFYGTFPSMDSTGFHPNPNYYLERLLNIDSDGNDGVWTVCPYEYFVNIFPIIDTTYSSAFSGLDTCVVPSNLRVRSVSKGSATLQWDNESLEYEVSLTRDDGSFPDDGTIYPSATGVKQITGLESGSLYVAYVRAKCPGGAVSDWSDSVRFYVMGDTTRDDNSDILTASEQLPNIMPNPAQDKVKVTSPYNISSVVVFDAMGNVVMRCEPGSMSYTLDISSLTKGVYVVAIVTKQGTVNKRLVVK